MLRKGQFKFEEDIESVEGWLDDEIHSKYPKPYFTSDNLKKIFSPYPVTFGWTEDSIPQATIHFDDHDEILESSPVWNGEEFLIGYAPEGYEFEEVN